MIDPSPALKQLPALVLFISGAIMSSIVPTLTVSDLPTLVGSVWMVIIATMLSIAVTANPRWRSLTMVVPMLDFLASGTLRFATGENRSIYASFVILPVLWFAAEPGRKNVAFAAIGSAAALLVPFALGSRFDENPDELLRGVYSTAVFVVAAFVVNEMAARLRSAVRVAREREQAASGELDRAAQVQRALLPTDPALLPGFDTAGVCIPSRAVGGDFYDWYETPDGIAFTLGDVMGKGVGAGMVAAMVRAVIRSARQHANPAIALARAAECFATDLGEGVSFATVFHGRLWRDGRISYSDAGHGLTLIVHPDGTWERLASDDLPLGIDADSDRTSTDITLEPYDMLISFSDGVLDLYDGTLAALDDIAKTASASVSANELVNTLAHAALQTNNPDDVTVVVIRRTAH